MSEYEDIKRKLGEEQFKKLICYLKFYPYKLLSDVFYNKEAFQEAIAWYETTPKVIKENPPLYLVIEDYKGLREHNYFGTKEEVLAELGVKERDLECIFYPADCDETASIFSKQKVMTFYRRESYISFIHIATSMEDVTRYFAGRFNAWEVRKKNPNWYYMMQKNRCGRDGLDILSCYRKEDEFLSMLTEEFF